MSRSDELFARALRVAPGGVHSPVRSFRGVGGRPVFIDSARGATLTDVDRNSYVDFCMSFGPLIHGHSHPAVKAAVVAALDKGWSFGAAEAASLNLAEFIIDRVNHVDSIRFVNSGTEAVMSALRLARAATGRDLILKFDGCYHGHTDAMLIRAGSGLAGRAVADSAGVPAGVTNDTLIAPLDDEAALEQIFARRGNEIAAAIIEPLPANCGLLPQRQAYLDRLAKLCAAHECLLILDEVITGFRVAFGGFTEVSGMRPDIVTWGKIVGGGFPVGAIAGRRELMDRFAPNGDVYQAGTLSANPVAMAAGLATLELLADTDAYARLEELGKRLDAAMTATTEFSLMRRGSLFWLVAANNSGADVIRSVNAIPADAAERFAQLFDRALAAGVYLPPSAYEIGFLSTAHSPADIDLLARVVADHSDTQRA
ncbi:MAG: glutamate-1-semialdehyde 2,1-aminomutase [Gammaproteobacteria bacterium]